MLPVVMILPEFIPQDFNLLLIKGFDSPALAVRISRVLPFNDLARSVGSASEADSALNKSEEVTLLG